MRLVLLSDTHNHPLSKWLVPDGDVLVHSGDFLKGKKLDVVRKFNDELGELPHRHKIVVAGNHDWPLMLEPDEARALLTSATYLEDQAATICGLKFYGSPWQPEYKKWAFNLPRHSAELKAKWDAIPDDVAVLVTHTPPHMVLDRAWPSLFRVGCELLRQRLKNISPLLHVFGHIHEQRGAEKIGKTQFVNASSVDYNYRVTRSPAVVDIDLETREVTVVRI